MLKTSSFSRSAFLIMSGRSFALTAIATLVVTSSLGGLVGCLSSDDSRQQVDALEAPAPGSEDSNEMVALPPAIEPPPTEAPVRPIPPGLPGTPLIPISPPQDRPVPLPPMVTWSGGERVSLIERFPSASPLTLIVAPQSHSDGCSLSPQLPQGLSFDTSQCRIIGAPQFPTPRTRYTLTTWNLAGETEVNFELEVRAQPRFVFTSATALDRSWNGSATRSNNLWVTSLDGKDRYALTHHQSQGSDIESFQEAAADPFLGYRSIVYRSSQGLSGTGNTRSGEASNLWLSSINGEGSSSPLTFGTDEDHEVRDFTLSSDGNNVFYVSVDPRSSTEADVLYAISTQSAPTSAIFAPKKLTTFRNDETEIRNVRLSPDSRSVYFVANDEDEDVFGLYRVNLENSEVTHLTPEITTKKDSIESFELDPVRGEFAVLRSTGKSPLRLLPLSPQTDGGLFGVASRGPGSKIKKLSLPGGIPSDWRSIQVHPRGSALLMVFEDRILETSMRWNSRESLLTLQSPRIVALSPAGIFAEIRGGRYDVTGDWILFSSQVAFDPASGGLAPDQKRLRSYNLWVTPSSPTLQTPDLFSGMSFPRALTRNTKWKLHSY